MIKKLALLIFMLTQLGIVASILFLELSDYHFYLITYVALISAFILYPTNYKFKSKTEFLVLPVLVLVLISTFNLFFIRNYHETASLLNLIISCFCFALYFLYKKEKETT